MTENLPAPWQQPKSPIAYDPSVDYALRRIMSGSHREGRRLLLINTPTVEEKTLLAARTRAIIKALKLWNTDDVVRAVTRMLSCFEQYLHETGNETKAGAHRKIAAKWAMELQGLPSWAVERACGAIRAGEVEDASKDFPPSIPRVRALAESYCSEYRAELDRIVDALQGEPWSQPATPEERERVKVKLRTFADEMRADLEQDKEAGWPKAKPIGQCNTASILGQYKALGIDPVRAGDLLLSPALLKSLGRLPSKGRKASQRVETGPE